MTESLLACNHAHLQVRWWLHQRSGTEASEPLYTIELELFCPMCEKKFQFKGDHPGRCPVRYLTEDLYKIQIDVVVDGAPTGVTH